MTEPVDLRTGKPVKKIRCYKCDGQRNLLVEEKRDSQTGKLVDKNFICLDCAGGPEKVFA